MSNYEPRLCNGCGAPLELNSQKCGYCRTSYEYVGPRVPEPQPLNTDILLGDGGRSTIPQFPQTITITTMVYTDATNLTNGMLHYVTR